MKSARSPIFAAVTFAATAWIGGLAIVNAQNSQPSVCLGNGKTFTAGEISLGGAIAPIETKAFTSTPAQSIKTDAKLPAMFEVGKTMEENKLWSVSKTSLQVGNSQVTYPIVALMKGRALIAEVLKVKTDIKAGEVLREDNYEIRVSRTVKTGDVVPVLRIIGDRSIALLSIEASSDGKPWFIAAESDLRPGALPLNIEVWEIERQHVAQDGGICGF